MKGSALASLKFSHVPGKSLVCTVLFSKLSLYVCGWRAMVPTRWHLQGALQAQSPAVSSAPDILWDTSVCPGLRDAWGDGTKIGTRGRERGKERPRSLKKPYIQMQSTAGGREMGPSYSGESLWEQSSPVQMFSACSGLNMVPGGKLGWSTACRTWVWRPGFRFLTDIWQVG